MEMIQNKRRIGWRVVAYAFLAAAICTVILSVVYPTMMANTIFSLLEYVWVMVHGAGEFYDG